MRDCEASFVEIDGNSGRSYNLAQALVLYHELFQPEQGIRLQLGQPEVTITQNSGGGSITLCQDFGPIRRSGY